MPAPQLVIRVAASLDELKRNLAEGVNQIEITSQSLVKMAASYDGSRIIQQAGATAAAIQQIGGVTNLTAAEQAKANAVLEQALAKYAALGKEAPPGMRALADATKQANDNTHGFLGTLSELTNGFVAHVAEGILLRDAIREVISTIKELATETIENAVRFDNLSHATGLSTDAIQQFAYVGKAFGVEADEMARAVEQLSTKLATGDPNATKAVGMLGMSVKALLAAGPREAFLQIVDGASQITDPMERSAVLTEVFGGKLGKIISQLPDLRDRLNEVPKGAIISKEAIDSLHEGKDAWDHFWVSVEAGIGNYLGYLAKINSAKGGGVTAGDVFIPAAAIPKPPTDINLPAENAATKAAIDNATLLANRLKQLRDDAMVPLNEETQKNILLLKQWGVGEQEIAQLTETNVTAVHAYIKATEDLTKTQAESNARIMASYESQARSLRELTAASLKSYSFEGQIANLNQLDAAERALAKTTFESLTSEKDRAKVIEETTRRHLELMNEEMAVQRARLGVTNAAVLAEFDAQTKLNAAYGLTATGGIAVQETALDRLTKAMDALHATAVEGISQQAQEDALLKTYTGDLLKAAEAEDAARNAMAKKNAELANVPKLAKEATDALRAMQGAFPSGASLTAAGFAPGLSISGSVNAPPSTTGFGGARASGGPVEAGQRYLVGERGPELFVPERSGSIVPNGGGSAAAPQITIHVTQPLGTPRAIAAAVSDALMANLRGSAMRLPTRA